MPEKIHYSGSLLKFLSPEKKSTPEEDEAEEAGDSVWRSHILCGCFLTISDAGSSPT